jgi:hypothetical protein
MAESAPAPLSTTSTVQEVLESVNAYIIAFDGLVASRFVWAKVLEQGDEPPVSRTEC